ncbi:MAG: hypothetical protein ABSH01_12435 [Terriglobia bacterium]
MQKPRFWANIGVMKFEDAIRHLKSIGLAAVMPDGELHPISRKIRRPRGFIPVRILKRGSIPRELREMMRQSRAETRISNHRRTHG